ncbi:hypothetical protein K2X85_20140 [bacterium]|nr:hypothetical protein [bacterium]
MLRSPTMLRSLATTILLGMTTSSFAGLTQTITDSQPIIDWPLCRCGTPLPGVLDFALFDYGNQAKLCTIDKMEFTFTMEDGDTGAGNFDFNNLTLALDDVDTGIKLNGFNSGQENTVTFSLDRNSPNWISDSVMNQILSNLNSDGQLLASIVDATPNDNDANLYSIFDTTLKLTGTCPDAVPEPEAILVWAAAGTVLVVARMRRKKLASN